MFRFSKAAAKTQRAQAKDQSPSIVLLLREPVLPDAEQAIEMATAAWGAAGPPELLGAVGPHNFVIRVAPLTFAVHAAGQRYEVNTLGASTEQQQCWSQHGAWLAVDLAGKSAAALRNTGQLADAYKALMYFPYKHWSQNCLALYFPAERTARATLPNYGELIQSIRLSRKNGIDLDFLKESKA